MIDYVLDAGRAPPTGTRPLVVYSPATEAVRDAVAGRADAALQDEPRGTGDALAGRPRGARPPASRRSSCCRATCPLVRRRPARGAARGARARPRGDRPRRRRRARPHRPRPGRAQRRSGPSSGSSRTRTPPTRSWQSTRSTPACTPSMPPGSAAGSATCGPRRRPASSTSPTSSRFAREDGRLVARARRRGRRPPDRHQRPRPARRAPSGTCGSRLNDRWMRAGVTMLDPSTVYLDHGVELAPDVVLEPNVILRGATTVGERHADRRPGQQIVRLGRSARTAWSGPASSSGRPSRTRSRSGRSATSAPGAHVGRRRRDRQLRRDQEQPPRRARPPAPHELPRRRRGRRGDERRRRHDHRQLRRRAQAPDDDRRGRVPRRRHDAPSRR